MNRHTNIGKPSVRGDALNKVLGTPLFTADMIPSDSLFLAIVRSTRPHARILGLDLRAALSIKGVKRFIGPHDVPGVNNVGCFIHDKQLLCDNVVRCVGDPIGAVLAESRTIAERGAQQVEVEYANLPAIFSPYEALKPDAVKIHANGNLLKHLRIRKGDVERGFSESNVIVENEYKTQMQEHAPLEPEAAFAQPPDQNGIITIVGPWQCPFDVQEAVALVLGVATKNVRIVQSQTGGAFGCRSNEIANEMSALVALAASITGKPVAITMSREESTVAHSKRHPFYMRYKTGATSDGILVAEEVELISDTGAYASFGPNVMMRAIVHCTGPYVIPNVKADGYCVYTNNPYAGSFRGFGCPQVHFAAESQINCLASSLSMDPIELRMKNLLRPGSPTNTGHLLGESVGLEECLKKASNHLHSLVLPPPEDGFERGIGIAIGYHGNSLGPEGGDRCSAIISIREDGQIDYLTGLAEYGAGARFGHAQIIAETLGVQVNRIRTPLPDTSAAPFSGPTVASRSTVMGGNAALKASKSLREILGRVAAKQFNCKPEDVEFDNDLVCGGNKSNCLRFEELVSICRSQGINLSHSSTFEVAKTGWNEETGLGVAYSEYTFGAIGTVVDVNRETGFPRIVRVVAAFDCGKTINPMSVISQIEGAVAQGLGYAVMEDLLVKDGQILNPNLTNYLIFTAVDVPEIDTILVDGYPSSIGPFGAKAIAEPAIDMVAPAVIQAIYDAIGNRVKELPATPEKIRNSL